jgi:hypothetical protein
MLRTDKAPIALGDGFFLLPDHADSETLWLVSTRLALMDSAAGTPGLAVVRYRSQGASGALLSLRLGLAQLPAALAAALGQGGKSIRPAPLAAMTARLRLRSPTGGDDEQTTPWLPGRGDDARLDFGVSLSPTEAELFSRLLALNPPPLDVEATVVHRGLVGAMPAVARVATARLAQALQLSVPAEGAPAEVLAAVVSELLAADPTLFVLERTDRDRGPFDPAAARLELATRLLPSLAVQDAEVSAAAIPRWRLLPTIVLAAETHVSLTSARPTETRLAATFPLGAYLAGLSPERRAALVGSEPDIDVLDTLSLVARAGLPLSSDGVRRIDVGLRYRAASGRLEQPCLTLTPGQPVARLDVTRNRFLPTPIERRVTAVVAGPEVPRLIQLPYAPTGPVVTVDEVTLGLRTVDVSAERGLFARVSRLVVVLRVGPAGAPAAQGELSEAAPQRTFVLPDVGADATLYAQVTAYPPAALGDASPRVLSDGPCPRALHVSLAELVSASPLSVTVSPVASGYAYLAVTVRAPTLADTFLLLDGPRTFLLPSEDPFLPPRFTYVAEWMAAGAEAGGIVTGKTHEAAPPALVVDPALET